MIYVNIVYKSKLTQKWMQDTKTFKTKESALRGIYALRSKGIIIDSYQCDDYMDNEWLNRRVTL